MRLASLLALGLVLSGCANESHRSAVSIDPEFRPYVERFEQAAAAEGAPVEIADLSIRFGTLSPEETGRCAWFAGKTPKVTIDPEAWEKRSTDLDHRLIVFHELGHCILRRKHESALVADGSRPASLMYPKLIDDRIYAADRDAYDRELFDPAKRNQF